jgi:hypothetical protein
MNPLTGLYGAATALRNTLFDRGVLSFTAAGATGGQRREPVGRVVRARRRS